MNLTNYHQLLAEITPKNVRLVAVSKTKPNEMILEMYGAGQRIFGENRVQELVAKAATLPHDIDWHLIGHLQSNKVKYIAPFVRLIHSIDDLALLQEVNKQALKQGRTIDCLLQIFIAQEETKYGLSQQECIELLSSSAFQQLHNVRVVGLMGMATNTDNTEQVRSEFRELRQFFETVKKQFFSQTPHFTVLSMGMSGDYRIAIEEGSNMIRVGSMIMQE